MEDHLGRIARYHGSPREIGLAIGRELGARLGRNIDYYIDQLMPMLDMDRLRSEALAWVQGLPRRFQDELEGMAEGAGLPLQRLAEWEYSEECELSQCSGMICMHEGHAWVARNNDTYVPEMWGYATIREVDGRIPTTNFSMEGDVFSPTGVNQQQLWLHYNFLSVPDRPRLDRIHLPGYAFLVEALETCRTIGEVEKLLGEIDRDGGMLLFIVDGKNEQFAIFECTCTKHYRRDVQEDWIVGTNHYCQIPDPDLQENNPMESTLVRFHRIEELYRGMKYAGRHLRMPQDLASILADEWVERRGPGLVTVYANVACPGEKIIWYTFGGFPAASQGNWQRFEWPWRDG